MASSTSKESSKAKGLMGPPPDKAPSSKTNKKPEGVKVESRDEETGKQEKPSVEKKIDNPSEVEKKPEGKEEDDASVEKKGDGDQAKQKEKEKGKKKEKQISWVLPADAKDEDKKTGPNITLTPFPKDPSPEVTDKSEGVKRAVTFPAEPNKIPRLSENKEEEEQADIKQDTSSKLQEDVILEEDKIHINDDVKKDESQEMKAKDAVGDDKEMKVSAETSSVTKSRDEDKKDGAGFPTVSSSEAHSV